MAAEGGIRLAGKTKVSIPGQPLISIVTVTYNAVADLEVAMASVFEQSYSNIEYIIVDGGSSDGTVGLLEKYSSRLDYWKSEPDSGLYDAMNKAALLARGDWLYFLGSDDRLYNVLHRIASELVRANSVYYGDVFRPALDRTFDGRFTKRKLMFANICHQSIFYPRSVFGKYRYETKYRILADWVLNMRISADPEFQFAYLPQTVAFYEDRRGVSAEAHDPAFERDKWGLVRKMVPPLDFFYYCAKMGGYHLKVWCRRQMAAGKV